MRIHSSIREQKGKFPQAIQDWQMGLEETGQALIHRSADELHIQFRLSPQEFEVMREYPRYQQACAILTLAQYAGDLPEGLCIRGLLKTPDNKALFTKPHKDNATKLECLNETDWWNHLRRDTPARLRLLLRHHHFQNPKLPSLGAHLVLQGLLKDQQLHPEDRLNIPGSQDLFQSSINIHPERKPTPETGACKWWQNDPLLDKIVWNLQTLKTVTEKLLEDIAATPPLEANLLELCLAKAWQNAFNQDAAGGSNHLIDAICQIELPPDNPEIFEIFRSCMPAPQWFLKRKVEARKQGRLLGPLHEPTPETRLRWFQRASRGSWPASQKEALRHYLQITAFHQEYHGENIAVILNLIRQGLAPKTWVKDKNFCDLILWNVDFSEKEIKFWEDSGSPKITPQQLLSNEGWDSLIHQEHNLGKKLRAFIAASL
jgi:hypothetical protein